MAWSTIVTTIFARPLRRRCSERSGRGGDSRAIHLGDCSTNREWLCNQSISEVEINDSAFSPAARFTPFRDHSGSYYH